MTGIVVADRAGRTRAVKGDSKLTLMEILRDNDLDIAAVCGGCCSCATCHVYVEEEWLLKLAPQTTDESELLEGSPHRKVNSRLSCQIRFRDELGGLKVTVAPED